MKRRPSALSTVDFPRHLYGLETLAPSQYFFSVLVKSVLLEVLDCAFMFGRGGATGEGTQISAAASLGIFLC
jgi:hypothetical protein